MGKEVSKGNVKLSKGNSGTGSICQSTAWPIADRSASPLMQCALLTSFAFEIKLIGGNNQHCEIIVVTSDDHRCR